MRASRFARRATLALAIVGFVWAGWLTLFGDFDTEVLGVRVRSNAPLRPFIGASIAFIGFILLGGRVRLPLIPFPSERLQVLALGAAVTIFGITYATTVAGGSDSYGYISQADLWLEGDLRLEQPWVSEADFASRRPSFAPLGYRALNDDFVIVPTYPPGLPLLFAGAKAVGGQEAMFWVVPLLGGLLVLATYGVARRVAPPGAAVIAAWLTATCPVMIFMLVSPMSDVAVSALWMSACYLLIRPGVWSAVAAGLVAALAVLVRPNLVFIAAILAAWPLWQAWWSREGRGRAVGQVAAFGICVSAGAIAVALINRHLYGAATTSGYGDLTEAFARAHIWPNMVKYTTWLVETHTIAAVAGALALLLPWRRLWPDAVHRRFLAVSASIVVSVWLIYCLYIEFDAWWFLRFMLPTLPFIAIGTAAIAVAIRRAGGRTTGVIVALGVVLVVMLQFRYAADSGASDFWRGERRYVGVGRLVRAETPDNSVIFSMQHSGSIRYYGGRMTLRFDNLEGDSLDEAVAWLSSRGVRSFLMAEDWEVTVFKDRFKGQATLARLGTPLVIYRGSATALLFDLDETITGKPREVEATIEGLRSAPPAPPPQLVLR